MAVPDPSAAAGRAHAGKDARGLTPMPVQTSDRPAGPAPVPGGDALGREQHAAADAGSWSLLPPVAMFALAALVLGWPWLSGAVTIPWDAKAGFLPQIQFLAQSIASGESPFWLPYAFSGHPQVA